MATLDELAKLYGGTTKSMVSQTPANPYDVRTYQPGPTTNAGSTPQTYTPPKSTTTTPPKSTTTPSLDVRTYQGSTNNSNSTQPVITQPQTNTGGMSFGGTDTSQAQNTYKYTPPPLSKEQSAGIAASFGLQGIANNKFVGMTTDQANSAAKALQDKLKTQISAGTSYSFNPQAISGFNTKVGDLKTKVDSVNNDTWTTPDSKKTTIQSTVKSFTDQLSNGFNTVEEFQNAINTNPEFDKSISEYQRMGGDVNSILGAIKQKQQTGVSTQNEGGYQTLDQYLGKVSTPAEKAAYDSLIPEQKSLQAQIAFENGIVDKYKTYYFGDENQIGLLQQKKQQAVEKANILDQQVKLAEDNAKAQADLLIQKNQAELESELATVEENRLTAKNYMTGMLAKLGALNTTGAAGEALVNVEQKYQKQAQSLRTTYNTQKQAITVKMNETINKIESKKLDAAFKIKEDLSKSEEDIVKEVFKLEADATRKSFDAVDKYLGMYRTQKDKYIAQAKQDAKDAAKAAADAMSTYNLSGLSFDKFGKIQSANQANTNTLAKMLGGTSQAPGVSSTPAQQQQQYIDTLLSSGELSPETQAVLSGNKTLMDLSAAERKLANKELGVLGIERNMLPQATPSISSLLQEAQSLVTAGNDLQDVKQLFLESYPEKSAVFDNYIKEK
jgi:hypothetical protein